MTCMLVCDYHMTHGELIAMLLILQWKVLLGTPAQTIPVPVRQSLLNVCLEYVNVLAIMRCPLECAVSR